MKDWHQMTLREAGVSLIDCDHRTPPPAFEGYPYIAIPQLKDGHLDLSGVRRITRQHYDEWTRKAKPQEHDVILSRRCNPGETAVVPGGLECALGQNLVLLRADGTKIHPPFLRWMTRSREWWEQVRTFINVGAVFESLRCADIPNFIFSVPPISEQLAIVAILGDLDDKIELNRRTNETLEALIQGIFQSRFLGAIHSSLPIGWRKSKLGEHVEVAKGLSYKGSGLSEMGIPLHNLNSIYEGGRYKHKGLKHYTGEYKDRHIVRPGDVIVANTEQGHDYLLIGFPAIVPKCYGNFGLFTHHIYRVRPLPSSPLTNHFIYSALLSPTIREQVIGHTNGTTVNALAKSGIEQATFSLPPAKQIAEYERIVAPMFEKQEELYEESRTLAALRDSLLPRLLSGELRVQRAEQIASNIVPLSVEAMAKPKKATDEFVEAIVIAQLVRRLATPQFPLGRKRYNKLSYFAHRKAEDDVKEHYLKKAAGPYSPWAKYGGPEKIADKNGYVKRARYESREGFVSGERIQDIDKYLSNYPVCAAIDWVVSKCKFKKNDDLELLTTVDFAAVDLVEKNTPVTVEAVKEIIATNRDWAPKLKREIFSDLNISRALVELRGMFPGTYTKM